MGPSLSMELLWRLMLASLLGAMIGLEREIHGRPAGFRTHLLVSLGSCLFVITSVEFYLMFGNFSGTVPAGVDPGRVAAQVVTGIGFLGAGAIIREKASIRGLTTAACLWVAAALGVACGVGLFYLAIYVTGIALASLLLLKQVEKRLRRDKYLCVQIWGEIDEGFIARIDRVMHACGIEKMEAAYDKNLEARRMYMEVKVKRTTECGPAEILSELSKVEGVRRVRVE